MDEADDPTGVRALLTSLPDPGPMPDDLVARIEASLAAERTARADASGGELRPAAAAAAPRPDEVLDEHRPGTGRIVDLAARRRRVRLAGLAAAAVVVVGLAIPTISRLTQATVTSAGSAAAPASSGDLKMVQPSDQVAGASSQALGTGDSVAPSAIASPEGMNPSVHLYTAAEGFTLSGWTSVARAAISGVPEDGTSADPLATSAGVGRCLAGLGVSPLQQVTVVVGRYDGSGAAVLVLPDGSAYLVPDRCGVAGSEAIATGRIAP